MSKSLESIEDVRLFLLRFISDRLNMPSTEISIEDSFDTLGLDSLAILEMTSDLEEKLACEFSPTIALDFPSVAKLSQHIAEQSL